MNWKDFFHLSRRERRGILLIFIFLVGIGVGKWLFTSPPQTIIEYIQVPESNVPTISSFITEAQQTPKANTQPSAPKKRATLPPPEQRTYYQQEKRDSVYIPSPTYTRQEKFPEGTVIDLNTADTTALKKIPGIGTSYAKRIVAYRNLLGGYCRLEQLQEVYGMYEELYETITPYFKINPDSIRRLELNRLSLDKLRSHPYINFYQAKAIVNLRKKRERLQDIEELALLEEFPEEERVKIAPYLSFE
ncbi:helix-hairpin-helix domain-containing protein [Bacteroidales bacterium OttesenSCG-928-L03]|nr:helix-hairpin-helix domain-containing protein [Bacteroidales bacterium OttesenSCG-928-L03]